MKKLYFTLLLCSAIHYTQAQVTLYNDSLVATEQSSTTLCYNNSSLMAGNSLGDRYLLYFNDDSIFLNVKQSGIWTRKIVHTGNNIKSATIAFHKDTLWACWKESAFIKARYSANKGNTWSTALNISAAGNVSAPSIYAASNGKIHFVWFSESSTDTTVLHNVYNKGALLGTPNVLSTLGYKATWPSVSAIGDTVLCSWKETHGVTKIYFARSYNGGAAGTWSVPSFTNGANTGKDPNLTYAYDAGTSTHYVYLVYDGNNKVYLQRSTDLGSTWSSHVTISNPAKNAQFAKVECNNTGFVGISWEHRTGVNLFDDTKKDVGFTFSANWGSSGSFSHDSVAYVRNPLGAPFASFNKIDENNFYLVWLTNDPSLNKHLIYERRIAVSTSSGIHSADKVQTFIRVYPNPTNGIVFLENKSSTPISISICDILGKEVLNKLIAQGIENIDISQLKNGIYFIKTQGTKAETQKIIIQNAH